MCEHKPKEPEMTDQPDLISRGILLVWAGGVFIPLVSILIVIHFISYHLYMGHHEAVTKWMDDWFFPLIWVFDYSAPIGCIVFLSRSNGREVVRSTCCIRMDPRWMNLLMFVTFIYCLFFVAFLYGLTDG
jgi:hypothetical protein